MKLTVLQRDIYKACDEWTAKAVVEMKTSCAIDCDACCYQAVVITPPEAIVIAEGLLADPIALAHVLEKLREEALATERLMPTLSKADREAYWLAHRPCAFLVNHRCTIYKDRPIPCRSYYVISPKEWCSDTVREVGQLDNSEITKFQMLFSYERFGPVIGPLAIMVLRALKELRPKDEDIRRACHGLRSPESWTQALVHSD